MAVRRPHDRTNYPPQQQQQRQPIRPHKEDPYYGHQEMATLVTKYITHLFACSDSPPRTASSSEPPLEGTRLPYFIAYAHHRTKLDYNVTFAALVLLQRLKARFPTARGSSGHRLFISAYMISSKVICDDTYSNKSWVIVAQNLFLLREVNQMEREMCGYLEWELTVDYPMLLNFKHLIRKDFAGEAPYPTYSLRMFSKRTERTEAAAAAKSTSTAPTPMPPPNSTTSPIPTFGNNRHPTPPHISGTAAPPRIDTAVKAISAAKVPTKAPYAHTAPLPKGSPEVDTPSPSYSTTTSPAMSASPQTPESYMNFGSKIGSSQILKFRLHEGPGSANPFKADMFAHAVPTEW